MLSEPCLYKPWMTMTYVKMSCALARHNIYRWCAHSRLASIPGIFCVLAVLAAPGIMMLLIRRRCGGPTVPLSAVVLVSFPNLLCTFTSLSSTHARQTFSSALSRCDAPTHLLPLLLLAHSVLLVFSAHVWCRSLSFYRVGL